MRPLSGKRACFRFGGKGPHANRYGAQDRRAGKEARERERNGGKKQPKEVTL